MSGDGDAPARKRVGGQCKAVMEELDRRIVAMFVLPPLATGSCCIACGEVWPVVDQRGYCSWCDSGSSMPLDQ